MEDLSIRTVIEGREVPAERIRAWEAARLPRAARRIGLALPGGTAAQQRVRFAEAKLALGPEEVTRRLARDVRVSDAIARVGTLTSGGRTRHSVCDLHATGGSAQAFADWFGDDSRADYELSMVAANPDHFLIRTAPDGSQEVVETTGGSPVATRFSVRYGDTTALTSQRDPQFPIELAGTAYDDAGRAVGGVRHQFRDEPGGFHARLLVGFPRFTPTRLIAAHRIHLACEFGNWVRFAFPGGREGPPERAH